jgi:hypothetical protein
MEPYRPLSKRGVPDPDLDTLHEGVEPWMVEPLIGWLHLFLWRPQYANYQAANIGFIEGFEMDHCVREPFDRSCGDMPAHDFEARIRAGTHFGLDVADYALNHPRLDLDPREALVHASALNVILRQGRSAWEVARFDDDKTPRCTLTRRDLTSAKLAISDVRPLHERAGGFLADSWKAIATRDPHPSEGYDKAVKAIEVAAQPVVSPANAKATLGTIVRDMRAKPSKWTFALGDIDLIIDMADRVWTQHYRHGTQQRSDHTLEEADAALNLAIPLVRYFVGGLVTTT